jgi:hypothetical protein
MATHNLMELSIAQLCRQLKTLSAAICVHPCMFLYLCGDTYGSLRACPQGLSCFVKAGTSSKWGRAMLCLDHKQQANVKHAGATCPTPRLMVNVTVSEPALHCKPDMVFGRPGINMIRN